MINEMECEKKKSELVLWYILKLYFYLHTLR